MNSPLVRGHVQHVGQGEYAVATTEDAMLTTILGSCVAACLWDEVAGIGGMNHIVLPEATGNDLLRTSTGVNAMELLINGIIRKGGARDRLQAKLFGGAKMVAGLSDVGDRNSAFARDFLGREGIRCVSESLGGSSGRRVQFWPYSGRARQMMLSDAAVPQDEITPPTVDQSAGGDVDLF